MLIELLNGMIKDGEGNISWFPDRVNLLKEILIKYKPKNIVEIGFNLGHSMKLILDTLPDIENVYIFDICEQINDNGNGGNHNYVIHNFNILKEHYKNVNMTLIKGDSAKTVKPFLEELEGEIDFIEVDGFHEEEHPYLDIQNTIWKLKKGGVLYLDDLGYKAIDNAIKKTDWTNFDTFSIGNIFYSIKK